MGTTSDFMGAGIPAAAAELISFNWSTTAQPYPMRVNDNQVWAKYIATGALPDSTTGTVAHGLTDANDIFLFWAIVRNATGTGKFVLPTVDAGDTNTIELSYGTTNFTITTGADFSGYSGYIYVMYLKTTV